MVSSFQGLNGIVLREYQLQALFWMVQREQGKHVLHEERDADDNGMWERHFFADKTPFYFCPLFRLASLEDPSHLYKMKGGIIADEMGLGKTITMLSLLLLNRGKDRETIRPVSSQAEKDVLCNLDRPIRFEGGSLIVCPLSLLYLWQNEIVNHLQPDALRCCVIHNGTLFELCVGRYPGKLRSFLDYDVVLTTYDTCAAAFARNGDSYLYETRWKRIILDEGHMIKNDKYPSSFLSELQNARPQGCGGASRGDSLGAVRNAAAEHSGRPLLPLPLSAIRALVLRRKVRETGEA